MVEDGTGGWRRSERCWGHAVSEDLVHWQDWPVALWPDSAYDREGVYSGNTFVLNDGSLGALYTGNVSGHQEAYGILAHSTDKGLTWQKKMVMPDQDRPNADSPVHWDAQVWRDGDTWQQLIGGSTGGDDHQGAAWLWTSPDLETWTRRANIAPTIQRGQYWELPYLIPLDGRHVLMVGNGNPYWIGDYDPERMLFTPDDPEPIEFDTGSYYAVNPHMVDDKGPNGSQRRIMHAWVTGPPSPTKTVPYWQGAHSIPRLLSLKENRVWQEPIPEWQALRSHHVLFDNFDNLDAAREGLRVIRGDALEARATFKPDGADTVGLKFRVSADGQDYVRVFYDVARAEFGVDGPTITRNATSFAKDRQGIKIDRQASFLKPDEPVSMHIFLDRSIIEVYVNGSAYTARVFAPADALGVALWSEGGQMSLSALDVWKMKSIW